VSLMSTTETKTTGTDGAWLATAKIEKLEIAIAFWRDLSESYDEADLPGLAQDACDTMTDLQVERDALRRELA